MKRAIVIGLMAVAGMDALVQGQSPRSVEVRMKAAQQKADVEGDLKGAIEEYRNVVATAGSNRALAATALVRMAQCYQKLGDAQARRIFERVIRDYADQPEATAVARAGIGPTAAPAAVKGDRAAWIGHKVDMFGQVSPDGRYLTYVDWGSNASLAVHDLVANTDRVLTAVPVIRSSQFAEFSTISKDSKQVAYAWFNEMGRYDVRVLPLNAMAGTEPRKVFAGSDDVQSIAPADWSRDGKWIAANIRRTDGTGQIGLISSADGTLRVLKSVDWRGSTKIVFSPDDRYLAYDLAVGDSDSERHVYVMAVDGSSETAVVADRSRNVIMAWAPGGRDLLFASDRTGETALWGQAISNGKPHGRPVLLKRDIGPAYPLGMSTAGTLFVYKGASANFVQVASLDLAGAKIAPLGEKRFQRFVGSGGVPSWSADGRLLIYKSCNSTPNATCAINVASVEQNEVRQLWPKMSYLGGLRLLKDGRAFFAIGRDTKGRNGAYRIDMQTAELSPITVPRAGAIEVLSTDEKTLYFRRGSSNGGALLARDLSTGAERELFRRSDTSAMSLTLSPDGRHIATVAGDRLYLVAIEGGTPREVLQSKAGESLDGYRAEWTPDGRSLLLRKFVNDDSMELWLVPMFDNAQPRKIDVDTSSWTLAGGWFAIHPSGRLIAFTGVAGRQGAEVWALENLLSISTSAR